MEPLIDEDSLRAILRVKGSNPNKFLNELGGFLLAIIPDLVEANFRTAKDRESLIAARLKSLRFVLGNTRFHIELKTFGGIGFYLGTLDKVILKKAKRDEWIEKFVSSLFENKEKDKRLKNLVSIIAKW